VARRSVSIYVNGWEEENHVRTFGGNGSDVREVRDVYKNMSKEEFLTHHPKFADMCQDKFELHVSYS
jgi:hypothetical protein